jgi:hypothetical protein
VIFFLVDVVVVVVHKSVCASDCQFCVSPRLDVYSFSMILWELLHAAKPFEAELFAPGISTAIQKMRMIELVTQEQRPVSALRMPPCFSLPLFLHPYSAVSLFSPSSFCARARACLLLPTDYGRFPYYSPSLRLPLGSNARIQYGKSIAR